MYGNTSRAKKKSRHTDAQITGQGGIHEWHGALFNGLEAACITLLSFSSSCNIARVVEHY